MKPLGTLVVAMLMTLSAPAAARADVRLLDAVVKGDAENVRERLQNGADVNSAQADGSTALMLAAERDEVAIATLLVRAKANVNAVNEYGATALYVASERGNVALIRLLLDAQANPNLALLSGETPLMAAVNNRQADAARALLERDAGVNARETKGGQTALMWAVANRSPQLVRLLVGHGADPRAQSRRGFTPLLFAAQQGDVESGRILLDAGAEVDERSGTDAMTPLMVAAASGNTDLSVLLIEKGASPDLVDASGYTALHYAAAEAKGGADMVRTLLRRGAQLNPRTTTDTRANTTSGVSVRGATPLFLAAARGNVDTVRALLDGGADPLIATDNGTAPLQVATWGGDPYFRDWTDDEKKNLLEVTKMLVERGSDINAAGEHGWTALHGAAYKGVDAAVRFLVEQGARLEVFDEYGQTPLSIAKAVITPLSKNAYYQSSRVVRASTADLLLKLGAKPLPESGVQILELFYKP